MVGYAKLPPNQLDMGQLKNCMFFGGLFWGAWVKVKGEIGRNGEKWGLMGLVCISPYLGIGCFWGGGVPLD